VKEMSLFEEEKLKTNEKSLLASKVMQRIQEEDRWSFPVHTHTQTKINEIIKSIGEYLAIFILVIFVFILLTSSNQQNIFTQSDFHINASNNLMQIQETSYAKKIQDDSNIVTPIIVMNVKEPLKIDNAILINYYVVLIILIVIWSVLFLNWFLAERDT